MSRTGREVRVRCYPAGAVSVDDFEVVEVPVPDPGPGQVLVRNTWTSVDPGLRLRPDAPAGYFTAFPLGRAMDGIMAVGEVLASRADGFVPGDTVSHALGWRDFAVVDPTSPLLGGIGTLPRTSRCAVTAAAATCTSSRSCRAGWPSGSALVRWSIGRRSSRGSHRRPTRWPR